MTKRKTNKNNTGIFVQLMYKENGRIKSNEQYEIDEFLDKIIGQDEPVHKCALKMRQKLKWYDKMFTTEKYLRYKRTINEACRIATAKLNAMFAIQLEVYKDLKSCLYEECELEQVMYGKLNGSLVAVEKWSDEKLKICQINSITDYVTQEGSYKESMTQNQEKKR